MSVVEDVKKWLFYHSSSEKFDRGDKEKIAKHCNILWAQDFLCLENSRNFGKSLRFCFIDFPDPWGLFKKNWQRFLTDEEAEV